MTTGQACVDLWRDGAADRLDGENGLLQRVIRVTQVQPAELAGEREAIEALLGDPDEGRLLADLDDQPGATA